jgi:phosphoglycerate dehydrogenase-like enzyme
VLKERRIAGAGLDVLEQEPPDPSDPILKVRVEWPSYTSL